MVIERDRYLDDGSGWLVTLRLQSRTLATHSLLTALSAEERQVVAGALIRALDEVAGVLTQKLAREGSPVARP